MNKDLAVHSSQIHIFLSKERKRDYARNRYDPETSAVYGSRKVPLNVVYWEQNKFDGKLILYDIAINDTWLAHGDTYVCFKCSIVYWHLTTGVGCKNKNIHHINDDVLNVTVTLHREKHSQISYKKKHTA